MENDGATEGVTVDVEISDSEASPEAPDTEAAPPAAGSGAPDPGAASESEVAHAPALTGGEAEAAEPETPAAPPAPPAPKKPRGRPRKDGLTPGSPEARAKDARPATGAGEEKPGGDSPPAGQGEGDDGASESAPDPKPAAPAPVARREAPPKPARRERAVPVSSLPKQQKGGNVCEVPHCTAKHPSQGGKVGVRCVETGAAIVAPMTVDQAQQIVGGVIRAIGFIVTLVSQAPVSPAQPEELGMLAGPTRRILHRFGVGEGNFPLDVFLLAIGLGMVASRMATEVRAPRPAMRAAA